MYLCRCTSLASFQKNRKVCFSTNMYTHEYACKCSWFCEGQICVCNCLLVTQGQSFGAWKKASNTNVQRSWKRDQEENFASEPPHLSTMSTSWVCVRTPRRFVILISETQLVGRGPSGVNDTWNGTMA